MKVIELLPHPQRLLQLFCIVDELVILILSQTLFLAKNGKTPGRPYNLTVSEAMTISLYRFLFPWTDFKHYYGFIKNYHEKDFSNLPHYDNMLTQQKQLLPFFLQFLGVLIAVNRSAFKNKRIRIMFIDASPLPVCANKRIFNHKVAKKAAKRGKSTMGWFYGFKLHILVDAGGNILGATITPGNVDDRTQVRKLVGDIMNALLIADAGYVKQLLRVSKKL